MIEFRILYVDFIRIILRIVDTGKFCYPQTHLDGNVKLQVAKINFISIIKK